MIEACFYFPNNCLDTVIETLLQLPDKIRPSRFSHDEGVKKAKDLIADSERFHAFLKKATSGFFLHGEHSVYSFRIAKSIEFVLDIDGISEDDAGSLLRCLGPLGVSFAYAAEGSERKHRNRVIKNASYGTHEAWVGRDWRRYIPGIYWSILVPVTLAETVGVPLDQLKQAAKQTEEISPGIWLMRFYDSSADWQLHADKLDALCAEIPGIFVIKPVRMLFESSDTFLNATAVLNEWR
ncbi:MAG: hypothetical protein ACREPB_02920 [Arenimonas sp.]